mmetsp:Transcript_15710/g.48633  ORF Transcript_15710/g.48633 Transcript_15710/m.48633 type:complete len:378 (-) Transcript_15710:53-1186(-)
METPPPPPPLVEVAAAAWAGASIGRGRGGAPATTEIVRKNAVGPQVAVEPPPDVPVFAAVAAAPSPSSPTPVSAALARMLALAKTTVAADVAPAAPSVRPLSPPRRVLEVQTPANDLETPVDDRFRRHRPLSTTARPPLTTPATDRSALATPAAGAVLRYGTVDEFSKLRAELAEDRRYGEEFKARLASMDNLEDKVRAVEVETPASDLETPADDRFRRSRPPPSTARPPLTTTSATGRAACATPVAGAVLPFDSGEFSDVLAMVAEERRFYADYSASLGARVDDLHDHVRAVDARGAELSRATLDLGELDHDYECDEAGHERAEFLRADQQKRDELDRAREAFELKQAREKAHRARKKALTQKRIAPGVTLGAIEE